MHCFIYYGLSLAPVAESHSRSASFSLARSAFACLQYQLTIILKRYQTLPYHR